MGIISPSGKNIDEFWDNIVSGKCAISKIEGMDEYDLPVSVWAKVKDFNPSAMGLTPVEKRRNDLYSQYGLVAAAEAMAQCGLVSGENIEPERFGVFMGSGIGGYQTQLEQMGVFYHEGPNRISPLYIPMMIPNVGGGNIAIKYNAQGPCLTHVAACATSTISIGEAFLAIQAGRADAIIAGGSEAPLNAMCVGAFANAKALTTEPDPAKACLPFDERRGGFVLGEGSAVMVLESLEHAQARGAKILGEIAGYGCTCDAFHYTSPRKDGIPASQAIKEALKEAGYKPGEDKLYVNAHGTGTHQNDVAETNAIKLALGEEDARRASISSTKSMHGHMIGATGAAEAIVCALTLRDGIVPPTIGLEQPDPECDLDYTPLKAVKKDISIALSNSLGFGGHNVSITLRKFAE